MERVAQDIAINVIALVFILLVEAIKLGHLTMVVSLVVDLEPPPSPLQCDVGRADYVMRRALAAEKANPLAEQEVWPWVQSSRLAIHFSSGPSTPDA